VRVEASPPFLGAVLATLAAGMLGSLLGSAAGAATLSQRTPFDSLATHVAMSPDGRHLYQASVGSIDVFARDRDTGLLSRLLPDATDPDIAFELQVSPDGAFTYSLSNPGLERIRVHARDPVSGALDFVESVENFIPGQNADQLALLLSPDGRNVYVVTNGPDAVVVFSRDRATGRLTLVEVQSDGVPAGAREAVLSPDGKHLYLTSIPGSSIFVFQRSAATGALVFAAELALFVVDPARLVMSPDGGQLYVANGGSLRPWSLSAFQRDAATGSLTLGDVYYEAVGFSGEPIDLLVSTDGQRVEMLTKGGALGCATAIDVVRFSRSAATGLLAFRRVEPVPMSQLGPCTDYTAEAFAANGQQLYIAPLTNASGLSVFSLSELRLFERIPDGDGGLYPDGLDGAQALAVSPDGRNLYAAGRLDAALVTFERLPNGGLIHTDVEREGVGGVTGLDGAQALAIPPDGRHIYSASYLDSSFGLFARSDPSGTLGFLGAKGDDIPAGPVALAVSPDGKSVYAAGYLDDAISWYTRDAASGALTFAGRIEDDPSGGVIGLAAPQAIAISPDGRSLYVGSQAGGVALLQCNPSSGALAFVALFGPTDLTGILSLAVSPDGRQLYAASFDDSTLAVFSRNPANGDLALLEKHEDGVAPVAGLAGIDAIAVSGDGSRVYAASYTSGTLTAFARSRASGRLAYRESQGFVPSAAGVAVSPDRRNVYVAAWGNSVSVFVPEPAAAALGGAALAALVSCRRGRGARRAR